MNTVVGWPSGSWMTSSLVRKIFLMEESRKGSLEVFSVVRIIIWTLAYEKKLCGLGFGGKWKQIKIEIIGCKNVCLKRERKEMKF